MKILIYVLVTLGFVSMGSAAETISEKVEATAKTAQRAVVKGVNRTAEALCGKLTGDNKAECLAKEVKNRAAEAKDVVVDKTSEIKNSAD